VGKEEKTEAWVSGGQREEEGGSGSDRGFKALIGELWCTVRAEDCGGGSPSLLPPSPYQVWGLKKLLSLLHGLRQSSGQETDFQRWTPCARSHLCALRSASPKRNGEGSALLHGEASRTPSQSQGLKPTGSHGPVSQDTLFSVLQA
jgi:hypothetical protein